MFKVQAKTFCNGTTLHGFKYISDKKRNRSEKLKNLKNISLKFVIFFYYFRIFWSVSVTISIILTAILIYKFVQIFNSNPIVIGTVENQISISDIYFPSLTICPSLIFKLAGVETIDYDAITKALDNHEITIDNLTLNE